MSRFRLSRRSVLRGIGGFTLALPPLEVMRAPGRALGAPDATPKYFCVGWGGQSLAGGDNMGVGQDLKNQYSWPKTTGGAWEKTMGLEPIFGSQKKWQSAGESFRWDSLQSDFGVVSGLSIPYGDPWRGGIHGGSDMPQLAGSSGATRRGPTADRLASELLGRNYPGNKNIVLSVQPKVYGLNNESDGPPSLDGSSNPDYGKTSPAQAFRTIVGMPRLATTDPATYMKLMQRQSKIVDLVLGNARSLQTRLGGEDRNRLQTYLAELNDLQTRIEKNQQGGGVACQSAMPGAADPAIGSEVPVEQQDDGSHPNLWSNETLRGELMTDLVALAFQCNITPVAFLRITHTKCMIQASFTGRNQMLHSVTHASDPQSIAAGVAWHVNVFARLAAKLKAVRDVYPDGSSVLDHTVLALLFEGGAGKLGPEEQEKQSQYDAVLGPGSRFAHSMEDMMVVYGGGKALGLKHQHLPAPGRLPAEVLLTLLNAVGVPGPLGMANRIIPDMGITALQ